MFICRCSRYIFISILLFSLSCSTKLPSNIDQILSDFFIYKNRDSEKKLSSALKNINELDSLLNSINKKGRTGASSIVLKDYEEREFTLGFNTPADLKKNDSYPLIIYLHGGTGTTRTDKGQRAWSMFQFLQEDIDIFIASPSANRECQWWNPEGLNRILISIRYMTLNYNIDPNRIFLAGVSDGGTACYAVADQIGEIFAGFFAISGMGLALQSFGINIHPQNLMQKNIYNINAGNDRLYPLEYVQKFLTSLENSGVKIKKKFYKRELHGFDYKEKERRTLLKLIHKWRRSDQQSSNHIFSHNQTFYNHEIANIEFLKDNSENPFINIYRIKDTINIRSSGIKAIDLFIKTTKDKKMHLKKSNRVKTLKPLQKSDIHNALIQLKHSYYPGDYTKNIYHTTLE